MRVNAAPAAPGAITALFVRSSLAVASPKLSVDGRRIDGVSGKLLGVIVTSPPGLIVSAPSARLVVVIVVLPPKFPVPVTVTVDVDGTDPLTFNVALAATV